MAQGAIIDDNGPNDPAPITTQDQIIAELKGRGWTDAQIQAYLQGGTPENPIVMGPEDPSPTNPGAIDLPLPPDQQPPAIKDADQPATDTTPSTTTPSTTTPSTTTPSGPVNPYTTPGADNPFGPWPGHYVAPTPQPLPDVPVFTPPVYTPPPAFSWDKPQPVFKEAPAFSYADFVAPSLEAAMKSPGYQFRLQQGTDRLQNAAAARGTLNDSGTLKALIDYGQDSASQEYGNVYNRATDTYNINAKNAADTYNTNYKTQYTDPYNNAVDAWKIGHDTAVGDYNTNYKTQFSDPYDIAYKGAVEAFKPIQLGYLTNSQNIQHLNDIANTNAYNDYSKAFEDYEARRRDALNFALGS